MFSPFIVADCTDFSDDGRGISGPLRGNEKEHMDKTQIVEVQISIPVNTGRNGR